MRNSGLLLGIHTVPPLLVAAALSGVWRLNLSKSSGVNPETFVFEIKSGFLTYSDTKQTYAFEMNGKEFPVGGPYEGLIAS